MPIHTLCNARAEMVSIAIQRPPSPENGTLTLDTLERDLRRELNRQEKVSKSSTIHRLEKQSIRRTVRYLETEIKRFKKHIGEAIKSNSSLQKDYELLLTIPGIGARTAWSMLVILRSRRFASAPKGPRKNKFRY